MGTVHYLVCKLCNQFIDIHKSSGFIGVINSNRPPVGCSCKETGFSEPMLSGGIYWEERGLWFLWRHRGHNVEWCDDHQENWYELEQQLTEVFPHEEDLEIRKRVEQEKPKSD